MGATDKPKSKDFTIAIVGGGVCGLALGIALTKKRVPVQVFEATPKFEQVGAGITLGPQLMNLLASIGVLEPLLEKIGDGRGTFQPILFVSGMEGHEYIYDYAHTTQSAGLGLHRAIYLEALLPLIDLSTTHFNKRCTSVTAAPGNSGRSVVHFADGTTYEADIVVGADGIKSAVRPAVVGDGVKGIAFGNTQVYRNLIPVEDMKAAGVRSDFSERPRIFMGKDKYIILYPVKINGQALMNFGAFVANHDIPIGSVTLPPDQPTVAPATKEELLAIYEGWGSNLIKTIECAPNTVSKWYIHMIYPPLETYVKGRVAIVGDAAHAMLPHLGAGAGQGLEDIFVLSELLSHPQTTKSNVEAVLQAYDRVRRPRSQMVAHRTTETGELYDSQGKPGVTVEGTRDKLKEQWAPVWNHDLDEDVEAAVSWLEETSVFSVESSTRPQSP